MGGLDSAGGKLKEVDTTHWENPNVGATNITGFTALPGGHRTMFDDHWDFNCLGLRGSIWSSTTMVEFDDSAGQLMLSNQQNEAYIQYMDKPCGCSVRCIMNYNDSN